MTALRKYQRLETGGLWRADEAGTEREVVVSFGNATLVLGDPGSGTPLSHWSLPAVRRLNPGRMPALYAPEGSAERLAIADGDMIDAVEAVQRAIRRATPSRGRLRGWGWAALAAVLGVSLAAWLPGAVVRHAARVAAPAQQAEIGRLLLEDLVRETGAARCTAAPGTAAAARLAERLLPDRGQVVVLAPPFAEAVMLPGDVLVLGAGRLDADPGRREATLGHALAAQVRATGRDPMRVALTQAGWRAALALLVRGDLPADSLSGASRSLLGDGPLDEDALLARFAKAGVPSEPYARDLDPSGETTLGLIEADPFRAAAPPPPLMSDAEWRALSDICAR